MDYLIKMAKIWADAKATVLENLIVTLVNCRSIKNKVDDFANLLCLVKPSIVVGISHGWRNLLVAAKVCPINTLVIAEIETATADGFSYWFTTGYRVMQLTSHRPTANLSGVNGVKCL